MKALVAYGNTVDDLRLTDIPVPEIGEDEVLVKVRAAGICGSDIGRWILAPSTEPFTARPYVGGHEFAGDVVKIGKYVTGWSVGDRVVSDNTAEACGVCAACAKGDYLNCNSRKAIGYPPHDGGFAEYVRIPGTILRLNPNSLMKIPPNVSYEEASILDPVCNAYQAVIQQSHLLPGDDALFYGPGPLGLFGVQFAKLMGCRNIIVVGTPSDKDIRLSVAKNMARRTSSSTGRTISLRASEKSVDRRGLERCLILPDPLSSPNRPSQCSAAAGRSSASVSTAARRRPATMCRSSPRPSRCAVIWATTQPPGCNPCDFWRLA